MNTDVEVSVDLHTRAVSCTTVDGDAPTDTCEIEFYTDSSYSLISSAVSAENGRITSALMRGTTYYYIVTATVGSSCTMVQGQFMTGGRIAPQPLLLMKLATCGVGSQNVTLTVVELLLPLRILMRWLHYHQ